MFGIPSPTWFGWFAGPIVMALSLSIVFYFYKKEIKKNNEE